MGIGSIFLLFTFLGGWVAISNPTVSQHFKTAVYFSFWPGLTLVCVSWVGSFVVLMIGLRTTAATRFERNHLIAMELAREVAQSVPPHQVRDRLKSVRLELKLNARAPDKLPIVLGLIATLAASARFLLHSQARVSDDAIKALDNTGANSISLLVKAVSEFAPEFSGIVCCTLLGSFVMRAVIHDVQDRLLRTESLLERATELSDDRLRSGAAVAADARPSSSESVCSAAEVERQKQFLTFSLSEHRDHFQTRSGKQSSSVD